MSLFSLIRHGFRGTSPPVYDSRFGTATDGSGWITFGINTGNRRVWVDSVNGSDANSGLTAATAKATLDAAEALFITGTGGDQLMIAGGQGQTYTDSAQYNKTLNVLAGISATYPTMVMCYDSTDPSNSAKYGKLLGSNKPKVTTFNSATFTGSISTTTLTVSAVSSGTIFTGMSLKGLGVPQYAQILSQLSGTTGGTGTYHLSVSGTTSSTTMTGQSGTFWDLSGNGNSNYATQGIDFIASGTPTNAEIRIVNTHNNVCFQNCRFNGIGPTIDFSNGTIATVWNISKCSFWGMWSAGRGDTSGIYSAGNDQFILEDCTFVHCGYKIGSSRDDSTTNGGASVYGHSLYFHTNANVNITQRRLFFIDSESDDWGCRPNGSLSQLVAIDQAAGQALTGYSGDFTEAPLGTTATVDDFIICGGQNTYTGHNTYGGGVATANTKSTGTYANNGYFFDNPYKANSQLITVTCSGTISGATQPSQFISVSNLRVYNYAASRSLDLYPSTNTAGATFSNCLLDSLTANTSNSPGTPLGGTNRLWTGGDYPAPITKAGLISGLGASSKADLANKVLAFPHLPWAQAAMGLAQTAFGGTLLYPTAPVPSLTGLPTPETVYKTTLNNLTVAATFVRVVVQTVSSATVSTDLDSTGSATCVITTSAAHGLSAGQMVNVSGFTPSGFNTGGPVPIIVISSTQFSYRAPNAPGSNATVMGTYKQGTVLLGAGGNSTFSATGLEAGMALTGTTISYDGSGSGAFPTISVTETNSDGAGSHTTTGLVIG